METTMPPGYFMAQNTVTDQEKLDEYLAQAGTTMPSEGVRLLVEDEAPKTMEGDPPHQRLVIAEFDSEERFRTWCDSPGYTAARQLRLVGSEGFALLAAGFEPG